MRLLELAREPRRASEGSEEALKGRPRASVGERLRSATVSSSGPEAYTALFPTPASTEGMRCHRSRWRREGADVPSKVVPSRPLRIMQEDPRMM